MAQSIIKTIVIILQMIKFSHTVFALPFALMAAFLAAHGGKGGFCGWGKLTLIILCMVFARSVAMTFNRIVDARIDALNPRTADRPLPAGKLTAQNAWWFLFACSVLFGVATCLFWKPLGPWFGYGNFWPIALALPVLIFICLYSFTKRFTWASHFWLGASLMLAPVGAWIAICPPDGPVLSPVALVLGLAVLLWVGGFDIIYACQDIKYDQRDGLYSLPARLGVPLSLWISRTCHCLTITALLLIALLVQLGAFYLTAVLLSAVLLIAEHLLVRIGRVKLAFDLNGLVGLLLAAATITDILKG
jgi:4-hydroxybenzoate polyprenyltransferase